MIHAIACQFLLHYVSVLLENIFKRSNMIVISISIRPRVMFRVCMTGILSSSFGLAGGKSATC